MAFLKTFSTPYGADVTYHHVCSILWDRSSPMAKIQLASFVNEAARRAADGLPLGRITIDVPSDRVPSIPEAYAAIKELPEWAEAADV